jgi:hypothetical protein
MYKRFENKNPLTKEQKVKLLEEYNHYYKDLINNKGLEYLNVKIPRNVFDNVLARIGSILLEESKKLSENGEVKLFLDENPLPESLQGLLPDNFRTFSLLLNSLKQWVSKESAATDRYLLGGTARKTCRDATKTCIIIGEALGKDAELHHPMRDGRPPILISKKGHDLIEHKKEITDTNDEVWTIIKNLRKEKHSSWALLKEGCNAILGKIDDYRPNGKAFANVIIRETGLKPQDILALLDSKRL